MDKHTIAKAQSNEATHLFHLIDKLFSINVQQHKLRNRISKYHPYKCLDFICMAITLIDFILSFLSPLDDVRGVLGWNKLKECVSEYILITILIGSLSNFYSAITTLANAEYILYMVTYLSCQSSLPIMK